MTSPNPAGGKRPPTNTILGLIAAIVFVIAALTFIDSILEKAERRDVEGQAQQAYLEGARLVKQDKLSQGIELLRKAHVLDRANTLYELDLIDALIMAAKPDEAEPLMNEIMLREPDDGRANLSAARLMLEKGKTVDAVSYYHRAIYGEWPQNAPAHRIAARLELVHLLVTTGRNKELLAELLPLQEEAKPKQGGNAAAIQKELGHLFLVAGSPSRAVASYQALIDHNPNDADAYAGLGESQLEQGQYRDAHAAFLTALRFKPEDPSIRRRLALSSALTELDPTPRRLASIEKYRRSLHILQLAYDDLNACIAKRPGAHPAETAQLLSAAHDVLASKLPPNATNERSEGILGIAEKTWQTRVAACGAGVSPDEEPLRLIIEKLGQYNG
jgi:tetratricopeptide (TPR) repeat protein